MRDVVVAGGGPAGSIAAYAIARQGLTVTLIEKDSFPRYHVGESLLSRSVPHLRDLDLWDDICAQGYVEKPGALFLWGGAKDPLILDMPGESRAFQVERSHFDKFLLDKARDAGVEVMRARVDAIESTDDAIDVHYHGGTSASETARFFVDATGSSRLSGRQQHIAWSDQGGDRCAVATIVVGAERPNHPHENRIITEASENGWIWSIPLDDSRTSLGLVTDGPTLRRWQSGSQALLGEIAGTTLVRSLLPTAQMTFKPKVIRYSNYIAAECWSGRVVRVGDAAMFVDPLFSTGVHGAVLSAHTASACIASAISGDIGLGRARALYDYELRQHFDRTQETVRILYGAAYAGSSEFWRLQRLGWVSPDQAAASVARLGVGGATALRSVQDVLRLPPALNHALNQVSVGAPPSPLHHGQHLSLHEDVNVEPCDMVANGRVRSALAVTSADRVTARLRVPLGTRQSHLAQDLQTAKTKAESIRLSERHSRAFASALVGSHNARIEGSG